MKKQGINFKRLTAFWLSVVLLIGSVYTGNNYNSYADQKAQEILESFKSENNKDNNSSDTGSITAIKATASDSGEITDGEVYDDTATGSDAIEDGKVATASNANAIKSLTAPAGNKYVVDELTSYIKLFEGADGSISDPADFAICKYGTKTMKIDFKIDPTIDIPEGSRTGVGGEIIVPKGFIVDETTLKSDDNWDVSVVKSDGEDTVIVYKSKNKLTYYRQTFLIEQDAQFLINNLSTYNKYKFAARLYYNYGEADQTLIVDNAANDDTASFSFNVENEEPTWTIQVQNNGITYNPKDIYGDPNSYADTTRYNSYSYDYLFTSSTSIDNMFNNGLVVKYHKTKGYITDDILFKFMTEDIPKPTGTIKGENVEYSTICVRYIDDDGNTIYIPLYDDNISKYYCKYTSNCRKGEYELDAAGISNQSKSESAIVKEFRVLPNTDNITYGEALYNAGTLEILVLPNMLYNKLIYENEWDSNNTMTFTSDYSTAVETKGGANKATGDPITISIENGTDELSVSSAKPSNLNGTKILQYPYWIVGGDDYMDTEASQPIQISSRQGDNWKIHDNFVYTVEYNGPSNYEEALYPVKLTNLLTGTDYGLTYKIYIKDAATEAERIVTIVGRKNGTEYYDYTPEDSTKETVYRDGRSSWDGTSGQTKLGDSEYVSKIEIIKSCLAWNYIRSVTKWSDKTTTLASTILRAQNKTLDSTHTNIPDNSNVELVTTVKANGKTLYTGTQNITTVEYIDRDTLELTTINSSRTIQVNHATKETGILGTYTLKKYPGTMDYDTNDPAVIVISGDGVTITDRVSATNQRLLYVVAQDGNIINVGSNASIKASDYTVNATYGFPYYSYLEGYEHVPEWSKTSGSEYAHSQPSYISDEDSESKLYNLTALYEELGIDYATKLVISQDWVNNWNVTSESGAVWTKCFYANKLEPGYLNYDNVVGINGDSNTEPVQLTYDVELYCKASDWYDNATTDANGGTHGSSTKKTQNLSKIVYGNKETNISTTLSSYSFVKPSISTNYGIPTGYTGYGEYDYDDDYYDRNETQNILAKVTVDGFTETKDDLYIDYDKVEYDFSGTDSQLLSITTGIGIVCSNYSYYILDIEYTTSDEVVHKYENLKFDRYSRSNYCFVPLEIKEGTWVTNIKIKVSDEGYIWSKQGWRFVQGSGLPDIVLCRAGADGSMPATYPSSTKRIGYQGNIDESSNRVYDQLGVKCKVLYEDIFGQKTILESDEGLSNYIARSNYTIEFTGIGSERTDYKASDKITYDTSVINRGGIFNATISPDIYTSPDEAWGEGNTLRLRPVFYFAIDKDFTPDIAKITGLNGASAVFYPPGDGKGYSGNADYGYLVIDCEDVAENNLPSSIKTYYGSGEYGDKRFNTGKYTYGAYTIPLIVAYDANEGLAKIPIKHMWADVLHDSGRDGTSGNYLADVELGTNETTILTNPPDIIDSSGKHISNPKLVDGNAVMLYRDLTNATGNQVIINTLDKGGMVTYVTENITGGRSQDLAYGRDFTALDESRGLFGNKIYLVGNTSKPINDFDIYVPVVKTNETNMEDTGGQSQISEYGLKYKSIDISEVKKVATGVTVSFTTSPNPGKDGYNGMMSAKWESKTPSDASSITGIKLHVDTLQPGARPYFDIQYQLDENKSVIGTQKAYQTFYCNYKIDNKWLYEDGYTSPGVGEYILEDMLITGLVWDETEKTYNSIYDRTIDSIIEGAEIKLYDKNGEIIEQSSGGTSTSVTYKTDETGSYELAAPYDGEFIVEMSMDANENDNWHLVKKLAGTQTNLNSYAEQSTAQIGDGKLSVRTDVLKIETNYAQGKYTLANINFGLYRMATLNDIADMYVHVGEKSRPSEISISGNRASFGDDINVIIGTPYDAKAARKATASDGTLYIEGLEARKTYADVTCTDMYGNVLKGRLNIIPYLYIKYDITTNDGIGTVSDAKRYYVESYSGSTSDWYNANDGLTITAKTGYKFAGWSVDKDATKDTLEIKPGSSYSINNHDISRDVVLYAIFTERDDIKYTIKYYKQKQGSPSDALESYEYVDGADDNLTGITLSRVEPPKGYEDKFENYKPNATLSDAELEQVIAADGSTIVNIYYDIDYTIDWYDIEQNSPIKKAIISNGSKKPSVEQEFIFTMEGIDGAPIPDEISGVTIYDSQTNTIKAKIKTKADLKDIEFGNITYDLDDVGKKYEYIIKEIPQDIINYTFDETATGSGYKMTVEIGIDGISLTKKISYSGGAGATKDGIVITNIYTAKGSSSSSGGGGSSSSTGWIKDSKGWKFRNSDGTLAQGTTVTDAEGNKIEKLLWQRAGYGCYAFGSDGYLVTGWIYDRLNNKWYYCDENVGMLHGWYYENQDGYWYYLSPITGEMQTGWQSINGKEYYFSTTLQAPTYTQNVATGFWVYSNVQGLRPFGSMYANAVTPDNHIVDASGALIK